MSETRKEPYLPLGTHLRYLREQQKQSLAEVSGAVEIDETELAHIEAGHQRPAEDILMLLISHFDMQDQEAVQLWELAGYDSSKNDNQRPDESLQDLLHGQKAVVIVMGIDGRTMYTDATTMTADSVGVTITFAKNTESGPVQPVSRVGMSYEQAHVLLNQLQHTLLHGRYQAQPKRLHPPQQ